MQHELKTWLEAFDAVASMRKRFDIRKEIDRSFREGDSLLLREWNEHEKEYTGRAVEVSVTYVVRGPAWDVPVDMVVMSITPISGLMVGSYPSSNDDPTVTYEILRVAGVRVPIEKVQTWTSEERTQADRWAGAVCLSKADGLVNLTIPPMPSHVERDHKE